MNPRLEFLRVDFDNSIHCHRSQHGLLCGGGGGRGGSVHTAHNSVCKTTVIGAEQAFTGDGPGGWGGAVRRLSCGMDLIKTVPQVTL